MQKRVVIEKKVGETPLQALEVYRTTDDSLKNVAMSYAGRLDPMASGKLLLLIGEECKHKEKYQQLDKEYEFEVLFGISTDTGDVLGLPALGKSAPAIADAELECIAQSLVGTHVLPYPAFSSKPVNGKPLFQHALDQTLETIEIPKREMRVHEAQFLNQRSVSSEALIDAILEKIDLLKPDSSNTGYGMDFRKLEIEQNWRHLKKSITGNAIIARFKALVSGGTYIRALAPLLANSFDTTAVAYSIHRTKLCVEARPRHITSTPNTRDQAPQ